MLDGASLHDRGYEETENLNVKQRKMERSENGWLEWERSRKGLKIIALEGRESQKEGND